MKIKTHQVFAYLIMFILFSSCSKNGKGDHKENKGISVSITVQIPSEEEAIQHIQTHANRAQQTVMVQSHYYERVQRKRRCDQIDQDLGRCTEADSWGQYGYKMVMENERRCCRFEAKLVSRIRGNWVATYLAPKDEWSVILDYKDDAKKEQQISWFVKLNKSNGIQVSDGG